MGSLLLRGGMVADGVGSRIRRADVLIEGPVITWIGTGSGAGGHDAVTLEAGSVVCPGFIDAHVHAELPVLTRGGVEAALAQGVTTLVVGQDGSSWIGAGSGTIGYLDQYFGAVNGVLGARQAMTVSDFSHRVAGNGQRDLPHRRGVRGSVPAAAAGGRGDPALAGLRSRRGPGVARSYAVPHARAGRAW